MTDPAKHYCFITPRYADSGTVGGAETLLRELAESAAAAGHKVTLLTTCARNHFTWANEREPGSFERNGVTVHLFPVDAERDVETFLRIQRVISTGQAVGDAEEDLWLRNNVNSTALCHWLSERNADFSRIVAGPYLFGLIEAVATIAPAKTLLVPCLHDEPFARVRRIAKMFASVAGCIFNTEPERWLAERIFGRDGVRSRGVVGMGIPSFEADNHAFAQRHGIDAPYIIYCGRRELLKGTPLLIDYAALFRQRTRRDVKLVLTGSGDVEIPASLRRHLLDCGFVSEQEKQEAMAGAVAFCHPSVNESLSIVLLEAWLARTAALVHAKGNVLRYQCRTAHGGLWFKDYPEFEAQLLRLLDDPALADALATAGRAYVLRSYAPAAVQQRLLSALG